MENNSLTASNSQVPVGMYVPKKKDNTSLLIQGVISLGVIILSFLVAIFVYIPYIQDINNLREKHIETQKEVDRLEEKYTVITGMGKQSIDENLEKARRIVPDDIRLSELATFINANASKFDLAVSRLNLAENTTDVRKDIPQQTIVATEGQAIVLGTIEGPFSLIGQKRDIFRFLDFLVQGGFATNFDRVQIVPTEDGRWNVSFVAVHHYLGLAKGVPATTTLLRPRLDLLDISSVTPTPTGTISPTSTVTVTVTPSPTVSASPTPSSSQ